MNKAGMHCVGATLGLYPERHPPAFEPLDVSQDTYQMRRKTVFGMSESRSPNLPTLADERKSSPACLHCGWHIVPSSLPVY
jgi:hypothetical protein